MRHLRYFVQFQTLFSQLLHRTCNFFAAFCLFALPVQSGIFTLSWEPHMHPRRANGHLQSLSLLGKIHSSLTFHFILSFQPLPGSVGKYPILHPPSPIPWQSQPLAFSYRWKANVSWPIDQVHKRRWDSFYLPHNLKVTSQNIFQRDCVSGSKQLFPIWSVSSK